jgi:phosphoenolpyruvate carboxylase
MRDIEMLSSMLADVVQKDNPKVFELYNHLRKLGMDRASDPNNTDAFEQMKKIAFDITPQDTLGVMRTFSLALNLINSAEVHHRLRVVRTREMEAVGKDKSDDVLVVGSPLPLSEDSVRGTIETILTTDAKENHTTFSKDQIYERLINQKVEIVLTAHPTEVNRKTLLKKYRRITETLATLDRPDLHPYERSQALDTIRRNIAALWGSDEIRRKKPTPQQEAAGGNAVVETVLWEAVPSYLRKLDAQCRLSLGRRLPIDVVPVKFSSWIGGDRDGNPNVTPSVTREVVLQQRLRAAKLFWNDLNELYSELAISSRYTDEMEELANTVKDSPDVIEKYRRVIGHLRLRLLNTVRLCEAELETFSNKNGISRSAAAAMVDIGSYIPLDQWADLKPIMDSADLMKPLKIIYDSLMATGFELVADGRLLDIIRRLATFGMTLLPIDIREESTKHTEALDAITRYLGIGSYAEWDEATRLNFLTAELASKRPLIHISSLEILGFSQSVLTTLQIFQTASGINAEALGAYVISQAQMASDVLAVMLLQQQFGMTITSGKMMRVVPLFETLVDLTNAPDVLDTLFSIPNYVGAVRGRQEVMVGYSDSAKDAGR